MLLKKVKVTIKPLRKMEEVEDSFNGMEDLLLKVDMDNGEVFGLLLPRKLMFTIQILIQLKIIGPLGMG
jgi:hypothetical protein